jgi:hypothetical protein
MRFRHAAGLYAALILALAAFTGTAVAGNGHGNGGGNAGGNGGGQAQQATSPPAQPSQQSTPSAQSSAHERKHEDKHQSTSGSAATTSDNSTGVKPSSSTHKDTHEQAASDKTKQYGNGQTAGKIATKAGYGNATLHGPGNSQPHKTDCGRHEVDVHALAHKSARCAAEQSTAPAAPKHASRSKSHVASTAHVGSKEHVKSTSHSSAGVSASAHLHVTICHATGSAAHPYVTISPSASGVFHGHLGHQDGRDIVPAFVWQGQTLSQNWDAAGQTTFTAGCNAPATAVQSTPTQTTATGSTELTTTTSSTVTSSSTQSSATQAATAASARASGIAGVQMSRSAQTPAASAGGVAGESVALPQSNAKPTGGVLGATTRLGGTVASTSLPFTGLPLWSFAAVAAALILAGIAVRRATADRF